MISKRILLAILINSIIYTSNFLNLGLSLSAFANTLPYTPNNMSVIPNITETKSNDVKPKKISISWVQACSCRSYYGVPHSCYYSPQTDYDYSCTSKCIREANQ